MTMQGDSPESGTHWKLHPENNLLVLVQIIVQSCQCKKGIRDAKQSLGL